MWTCVVACIGVALGGLSTPERVRATELRSVHVTELSGQSRLVLEFGAPVGYQVLSGGGDTALELLVDAGGQAQQLEPSSRHIRSVSVEPRGDKLAVRATLAQSNLVVRQILMVSPPSIVVNVRSPQVETRSDAEQRSPKRRQSKRKVERAQRGRSPSEVEKPDAIAPPKPPPVARNRPPTAAVTPDEPGPGEHSAAAPRGAPSRPLAPPTPAEGEAGRVREESTTASPNTAESSRVASPTESPPPAAPERPLAIAQGAVEPGSVGGAEFSPTAVGESLDPAPGSDPRAVATDLAAEDSAGADEASGFSGDASGNSGESLAGDLEGVSGVPADVADPATNRSQDGAEALADAAAVGQPKETPPIRSTPSPPPAPEPVEDGGGFSVGLRPLHAAVAVALLVVLAASWFLWRRRRANADDALLTETEEEGELDFEQLVDEDEITDDGDLELPIAAFRPPEAQLSHPAPVSQASTGVGEDVADLSQSLERLEEEKPRVAGARKQLENQLHAQREELRVQRAAIARTQRVLQDEPGGEDPPGATEPAAPEAH